MTTLSEYHAEQMKDPEYAAEYERLRPEYDIIDAIIAARAEENLTQRELAQRCGMKQSAFAGWSPATPTPRSKRSSAWPRVSASSCASVSSSASVFASLAISLARRGKSCMLTPAVPERRGACALDGAPIPRTR